MDDREIAKALRDECSDCSCFQLDYMCRLKPCVNLPAADAIDRLTAEVAVKEAQIVKMTIEMSAMKSHIARLTQERDAMKSSCITKQDARALVKQYAQAWAKAQNEYDGTCALLKELYDDIKDWDSFAEEGGDHDGQARPYRPQ